MAEILSWGSMDPNSEHQRWSRWIFLVEADPGKLPLVKECRENALRFFAQGFNSTSGRVKVEQYGLKYRFTVEIEGPPVHDPDYRISVKREFVHKFMYNGFGNGARLMRFETHLLAGGREDGTPPDQFLVLPQLQTTTLWGV